MFKRRKKEHDGSASRWGNLNIQIFVIIVIPLAILLLFFAFGSVLLHQSTMRALVAERDQRAVEIAAGSLSEQLKIISTTFNRFVLNDVSNVEMQQSINSDPLLSQVFEIDLAFFDNQGNLVSPKGIESFWRNLTDSALLTLIASISEGQKYPVFSHPVFCPDTESSLVFVIAANSDKSLFTVAAFSPGELAKRSIGNSFPLEEIASGIVDGSNNQIIFQRGNLSSLSDSSTFLELTDIEDSVSGAIYYQDDGEELVVAYSLIPSTEWLFITEESWTSLASPLLRSTELAPLVLVPVVILAIVALWFGARQIVAPLQALESRASALAWGDFDAVKDEVGGIAEIGRLQRALVHMADKVRNSQQSLRGYIGAITKGQEDERHRIARELHDETIQSLIALNQKVQLAQLSISSNVADPVLSEINLMIEQNIKDVRQIVQNLRPPYLEALGLSAALEMLVEEIGQLPQLHIDFAKKGRERRLGSEIELTLYRIAQEGLSNILRHSKASKAKVLLEFSDEKVRMIIDDNGQGFFIPTEPAEFAPVGHYGLLGIYERAELINAKLQIQSTLGKGTIIEVDFINSFAAS